MAFADGRQGLPLNKKQSMTGAVERHNGSATAKIKNTVRMTSILTVYITDLFCFPPAGIFAYLLCSAACAAASLAIGTRYGEQLT